MQYFQCKVLILKDHFIQIWILNKYGFILNSTESFFMHTLHKHKFGGYTLNVGTLPQVRQRVLPPHYFSNNKTKQKKKFSYNPLLNKNEQ